MYIQYLDHNIFAKRLITMIFRCKKTTNIVSNVPVRDNAVGYSKMGE